MSEINLQAGILFQQHRYAEAEKLLRSAIAENPEDPEAYALLALALGEQKLAKEALDAARRAVQLGPEYAMGHYAASYALRELERYDQALQAIREALRLDSENVHFYAALSSLHLARSEWKPALAAAEAGLDLDSEDETCLNLRSIALTNLGRRAEAAVAIDASLANNPENPVTHANQGWAHLHAGKYNEALEHFREALRLDPSSRWARAGIVEALRARNPLYGLLLRYFLWMMRLGPRVQFAVIIGAWLGIRLLAGVRFSNPELAPYINIALYAYNAFAYLSWSAQPLFDLLLRLDPHGRMVLDEEQIRTSNWVGLCLLAAAGLFVTGWATGLSLVGPAVMALVLVIPVAGSFRARKSGNRILLFAYTAGLALLIAASLYGHLAGLSDIYLAAESLYITGVVLYSWLANSLIR